MAVSLFCNVKHPKSGVLSDITPAGERSAVSTHCRYKDNARRVLGTARSDSGFSRKERQMKTKTKIAAFLGDADVRACSGLGFCSDGILWC